MIINTQTADFIAATVRALRQGGEAAEQYLTGSMGGFTFRGTAPDIVFQPTAGPNSGIAYVVEVKLVPSQFIPDVSVLASVQALVRVVAMNPGQTLRVALATNGRLFPVGESFCRDRGVHVISGFTQSDELARSILTWSAAIRDPRT